MCGTLTKDALAKLFGEKSLNNLTITSYILVRSEGLPPVADVGEHLIMTPLLCNPWFAYRVGSVTRRSSPSVAPYIPPSHRRWCFTTEHMIAKHGLSGVGLYHIIPDASLPKHGEHGLRACASEKCDTRIGGQNWAILFDLGDQKYSQSFQRGPFGSSFSAVCSWSTFRTKQKEWKYPTFT